MIDEGARELLKELRKQCGMSQAEVAKALGIRQSTVAMWENGTNLPRADKLPALSKLYHCPIEKLLGSKRKEGKGA